MKNEIRREMMDRRETMSEKSVQRGSAAITQRLLSLACVQNAQLLMAYCAIKNEPEMWDFVNALFDMGKRVALPNTTSKGIVAAEFCRGMQLHHGAYGILQPAILPENPPFEPEVVIVPGVVFDLHRCRIGFGTGYYDRYLHQSHAVKVGVCYERQIVDNIDAEPHDVCMDFVVTEARTIGSD